MQTFSALLAIVRGIHRWPVNSSHRRFDVFFDLRLNKWLSEQTWGRWFESPLRPLWRHCNVTTKSYMILNCYGNTLLKAEHYIDALVQDCRISNANELEILQPILH